MTPTRKLLNGRNGFNVLHGLNGLATLTLNRLAAGQMSGPAAGERPAKRSAELARGGRRAPLLVGAAAAGAGVVALGLGLVLGDVWPASQVDALSEAGALTAWGLPLSRWAVDVSAIGTVGMLLTAVLLPREGGALSGPARRGLRAAAWLALAWAVAHLAMLVFSWSDVTGQAALQIPLAAFVDTGPTFPEAVPYLFGAALAATIAAAASVTQTSRGALIVLVLSAYNLLPLSTQGHAQHSPVTAYALTVHVVALSLWVGGLAGLLIHVRRSPGLLAVAVPRFSALALVCFVAVGASGVTMFWVNLDTPSDLWLSRYALLVLAKLTALVTLGVFGWWHRRRTIPALAGKGARRAFVRLAAAEVVVMAAAAALGVALSRTPTPNTTVQDGHPHAAVIDVTNPSHGGLHR